MDQLLKFINNLNAAQRAVIVGGFSLLFVFLIGLLIYSNMKANDAKLNYTIAAGLTKNQVMLASNELEASGIPFTILGSGNNLVLKTNKENINIAKIRLVTSQSISSKHTGWEIFDKSSLGTTNFENNVKFLRATEGELARSLESISGIISASVKIALPKESVFAQKKTEPSASAVLNLRQGIALSQKQIDGVKSFIASAVPKLKTENIKLIDQNGALLEKDQEAIDNLKYISHEKYKKKIEGDYEDKIIALLEPFLGTDKVVARVSVSLDFRNQVIEQEIFEPEGTIRSQQTTETSSSKEEKDKKNAAVPGVQSNIQNPDEADGLVKSKANSAEEKNIINYEISKKVIKQKDNSFAKIEKIKAAVTFDSTILDSVENKEEFLTKLKSIVEDGIGADLDRGDKISVQAFKFLINDTNGSGNNGLVEDGSLAPIEAKTFLQDFGEYIQYLISAILLFVFYKKFIAKNDIILATGEAKKEEVGVADEDFDYEPFNPSIEQNKLKSRVRNQILSNIEGMDKETAAKYEVLVEEIDNQVNNHPEDIAKMIELLLSEGDTKLKKQKENN